MDIEEGDFVIEVDDEINRAEADDLLEDECCYWLYKDLRGRTPGRKLKRRFFKFTFAELICGFGLLVITGYEDQNLGSSYFVTGAEYGATILDLQFLVAIPSMIIGACSFLAVKYWGSLVTNRSLFIKLLYINIFYLSILLVITIWCTIAVFLTFRNVDWEKDEGDTQEFFLPFIFTVIFLCPYTLAMFLYILDFSSLLDDVELNGTIAEPDVSPGEVKDLSGLSLKDFCAMIFAVPLLILAQCWHCCEGMMACCHFCSTCGNTAGSGGPSICQRMSLASSSFFKNIRKQMKRKKRKSVSPAITPEKTSLVQPPPIAPLVPTRKASEKTPEQLENERELALLKQREAEEAKAAMAASNEEQQDEAANLMKAIDAHENPPVSSPQSAKELRLTANHFRSLWAVVETSGSFQCKIKFAPSLNNFTEHMKRQGFHVVFATSPATGGIEVGICNIRNTGDEPWFMARFLASASNFSAVMKCEDASVVEKYVKKFALAKILKIET